MKKMIGYFFVIIFAHYLLFNSNTAPYGVLQLLYGE